MKHIDVNNVSDGYLQAKFRTTSLEQTERLAELFAPVASAISKNQKLRIGFMGAGDSGKTSFIKKMLSMIFESQDCIQSINADYSNIYKNAQVGTWWHYDNYGYNHNEDEYENANNISSVHLTEWPGHHNERDPNFHCLWAFYYEGERTQAKLNQDREIDLYVTDEIAETPEFQSFMEKASEYLIN